MDIQTLDALHVEAVPIRGVEQILVAYKATNFDVFVAEGCVAEIAAGIADVTTAEAGWREGASGVFAANKSCVTGLCLDEGRGKIVIDAQVDFRDVAVVGGVVGVAADLGGLLADGVPVAQARFEAQGVFFALLPLIGIGRAQTGKGTVVCRKHLLGCGAREKHKGAQGKLLHHTLPIGFTAQHHGMFVND